MIAGKYTIEYVESRANDKPIKSITLRYSTDIKRDITYPWNLRKSINWQHVIRCRLDFDKPKSYLGDGDERIRPGFRI